MRYETLYDILGVAQNATMDEIKIAYRRQAMKWHPDRNPGNKQKSEEMFKRIGYAFKILSNPETRAEYDFELSEQERSYQQSAKTPPPEQETPGVSEEEAEKMFFEQLLDLAFELAARGYNEATIAKTLVGLDCPVAVAQAAAATAVRVAGKSRGSPNTNRGTHTEFSQSKGPSSTSSEQHHPASSSPVEVNRIDINSASWIEAKPFYSAVVFGEKNEDEYDNNIYLQYFERMHEGRGIFSFNGTIIFFNLAWFFYRKMYGYGLMLFVLSCMGTIFFNLIKPSSLSQTAITLVNIILWFAFLMTFSNYFYFKVARSRIRRAMEFPTEQIMPRLKKSGGTNLLAGIVSFVLLAGIYFVGQYLSKDYSRQAQGQGVATQPAHPQPQTSQHQNPSSSQQALYDQAVAEIEGRYPELNPDSPKYRKDLVEIAQQKVRHYMNQGIAPHLALRMAIADMEKQPKDPSVRQQSYGLPEVNEATKKKNQATICQSFPHACK